MPDITAKAFAELIHTPLYGQLRILKEQKRPNETDGQFKIPYYQPATRHIRRYYQSGNNPEHLPRMPHEISGAGSQEARIAHNFRAIEAFRNGSQAGRKFTVTDSETQRVELGGVFIRATPDLVGFESNAKSPRYLIFNCSESVPEPEIIRSTIELFHYTLEQNGVEIPVGNLEYICIDSDGVYRWPARRQRTIKRAVDTAAAIEAMWDAI